MLLTNSFNGFKHKVLQQLIAFDHQVVGRARGSRKDAAA
jgi:hypothetical protein